MVSQSLVVDDVRPVVQGVQCRLLGGFSVVVEGVEVSLGGPKQRLLLALLVCRANSVVSVGEMLDALWMGAPPRSARKNVQVYVSQLRKILGGRLIFVGRGYRLGIGPDECDVVRFEQLAELGRCALMDGARPVAAELLGRSIELWGDRPLAEFADEQYLAGEVERLTERFLMTAEDWADLVIERGAHREIIDTLGGYARGYLLRERLAGAWMRALAATGRASEALSHYEAVRQALARELGIEPSQPLVDLHHRLLCGDDGLPVRARSTVRQPFLLHQVPRGLPDFVGRGPEVDAVAQSCTESDVFLVTGPVGVGKTAFAVHMAHLLDSAFPDGCLKIDLVDQHGDAKPLGVALAELLCVIGLNRDGSAIPHALTVWRSWVAESQLLLVLDGATREDVVKELLPGRGRSRVIVTSRSRLSGLEAVRRIELPSLTAAEGTQLLGRIIGLGRVFAERQAAEEIVGCCDGMPLAVRIVGAKLSALSNVKLGDYLERLRDNGSLLDELMAGDLAVRSRYQAFYRNLTATQRAAYRKLVALRSPLDHNRVLVALAGLDDSPQLTLEALFESHLLAMPIRGATYRMPAFTHLYGLELAGRLEPEANDFGSSPA